jgi:hypothetical protein
MAVALVISVLIASIAYLIPRLVTIRINMDQMRRAEEAMSLRFDDGEDTITTASGLSEGPYGDYV